MTTSDLMTAVKLYTEWAQRQEADNQDRADLAFALQPFANGTDFFSLDCRSAIERLNDFSRSPDDPELIQELKVIRLLGLVRPQ